MRNNAYLQGHLQGTFRGQKRHWGARYEDRRRNGKERIQNGTQNGTQSGTQNATDRMPPLTELERIVLDVITSRPTISRDYMAEDLGRGVRTIQRALDALKTKGIIRRVGGAKGYWEIVWRNDM